MKQLFKVMSKRLNVLFLTVLLLLVFCQQALPQWYDQTSNTTEDLRSVHFPTASIGYVVGDEGVILKTTNGGTSWSALTCDTNHSLSGVYFSDANVGIAVGYSGVILKTTNGGSTWTLQTSNTIKWLKAVTHVTGDTWIVVGVDGIIKKTTNGGSTWTSQTQGTVNIEGVCYSDKLYAVHENGVYISTDKGTSWTTNLNTQMRTNAISFKNSIVYIAGEGGAIMKTTDGGNNWTDISTRLYRNAYLTSVKFVSDLVGYASGGNNSILKTYDGGLHWGYQNFENWGFCNSLFFINENTGYAVGGGGQILKTTNGGGLPLNFTIQPVNKIICGALSTTFHVEFPGEARFAWQVSTNEGLTWTDITEVYYGNPRYSNSKTNTLSVSSMIPSNSGYQYRCLAYGVNGVSISNKATLTYRSYVSITNHPSNKVSCENESVVFTVIPSNASYPLTLQWQHLFDNPGATWHNLYGDTSEVLFINASEFHDNRRYRCIVTNVCNSSTSNDAELSVKLPPLIDYQPVNATTCTGGNVNFIAYANNGTYQWQEFISSWNNLSNGGLYSGVTAEQLKITGATNAMNGRKYRCVFKNDCPTLAISDAATLTVNGAPSISAQPVNKTVCDNVGSTTFGVTASGSALTYQWQRSTNNGSSWTNVNDAGDIFGSTSVMLTYPVALSSNGNQFRCVVSGLCTPPATSSAAILTVNPHPSITSQPVSRTICSGESTSFVVAAQGSNNTYQWKQSLNYGSTWTNCTNGNGISGVTSATISISSAPASLNDRWYYCAVSGSCSPAANSNTVVLTVKSPPVITAQPINATVCAYGNTFFIVTASGSSLQYKWQEYTTSWNDLANGANFSGVTTSTLIISATPSTLNARQYRCLITGCSMAVTSNAATLTVLTFPNLTLQPETKTICEGGSTNFSVTVDGGALTHKWQVSTNNGFSFNEITAAGTDPTYANWTSANLSVNNVAAGNHSYRYMCKVYNSCGVLESNDGILNVNPSVTIDVQPINVTDCIGENATFIVAATGTGLTYQWEEYTTGWSSISTGGSYVGATTAVLTITGINEGMTNRQYRCLITGTCGTPVRSNAGILMVKPAPTFSTNPENIEICVGSDVNFGVTATGENITYQWQEKIVAWNDISNSAIFANVTTPTMNIIGVTSGMNNRQYRCIITGCFTVASAAAILTVKEKPAITVQPTSKSLCEGSNTSYSVTATGVGLTYKWQVQINHSLIDLTNTSTYSNVATPTLNITGITPDMNFNWYRCVVSGSCSPSVTSTSAYLIVTNTQTISDQPSATTVCAGGNASFYVSANGNNLTYQWQEFNTGVWGNLSNAGVYSNVTSWRLIITGATAGMTGRQYRCIVGGSCTPTTSSAATLTVNSLPTITGSTPGARCGTGTVILGAAASAGTVNWYSASTGGTSLGTGITFTTPFMASNTSYYVDATSGGCTSSARTSVLATINSLPTANAGFDATIPTATNKTLAGSASNGTGPYTYSWSPAGSFVNAAIQNPTTVNLASSRIFILSVTDAKSCIGTDDVTITVSGVVLGATASATATTICSGNSTQLNAVATGGTGSYAYSWSPATGLSNAGIANPTATPAAGVTYTVTVNDGSTTVTAPVTITVNATPSISSTTPNSRCASGVVSLNAAATAGTINWYSVSTGGASIGSGTTFSTPSISSTQTFYVSAVNAGCTTPARTAVVATVNAIPFITGSTSNSRCGTGSVSLSATGSAGTINWYNASSGGVSLATTANFNTPSIAVSTTYYCSAIDNGCTSPSRTPVYATVNQPVTIAQQPTNLSICNGGSDFIYVTATGTNLSYQWKKNGVNILNDTARVHYFNNVTPGDAGTYTCLLSGLCGTETTNAAVLTVNSAPVITNTLPTLTKLCPGNDVSYSISATGTNFNYHWRENYYDDYGTNSPNLLLSNVQESQSGNNYMCIVENSCGADTSSWAALQVYEGNLISFTYQSEDAAVCSGEDAFSFFALATGASNISYQWKKDGTDIAGAMSRRYLIGNPMASDAGVYKCVCTTHCNTATSNSATLTVHAPTVITSQPEGKTICAGLSASFSVAATGTNLVYAWYDAYNLLGDQSTCTINDAKTWNSGNIRCEVSSSCLRKISNNAVFVVNPSDISIGGQSTDVNVCLDEQGYFSVNGNGTGTLKYRWQKNGNTIVGATSDILIIDHVTVSDTGSYTCIVSNEFNCGTVTSNVKKLTIRNQTRVTADPISVTSCEGQNASFSATATGENLLYQWQKNNTDIDYATSDSYSIPSSIASDGGNYRCIVKGDCSSDTTSDAVLTINKPIVIVTQPVGISVCKDWIINIQIAVTGSGIGYQWKKDGVDIAGAYYDFYNIPSAVPGDAGNYTCEITGDCGTITSDVAIIKVQDYIAITAHPVDLTKCLGQSAIFTVSSTIPGLYYQWRKNNVDIPDANSASFSISSVISENVGNYSCQVNGLCNGEFSYSGALTISPSTEITAHPSNQIKCHGANVMFVVVASGDGITYQWMKEGVSIPGANSASYYITNLASADAGNYTCLVTGTCGNVTTNAAVLTVNPITTVTTQPLIQTVCTGQKVPFTIVAKGTDLSYQWQKDGVDIAEERNSTYTISSADTSDAGAFKCNVSGECGTDASDVAQLTVNVGIATQINVQPVSQAVCAGGNVSFNVDAIGDGTLSYQWQKDGSVITNEIATLLSIPGLVAADSGVYACKITSGCGFLLSDIARLTITVINPGQDIVIVMCEDNSSISVYPNPSAGIINLSVNGIENAELIILNVAAQVVYNGKLIDDKSQFIKQLNLSKFPKGIYFLKVTNGTEVIIKKIILQ